MNPPQDLPQPQDAPRTPEVGPGATAANVRAVTSGSAAPAVLSAPPNAWGLLHALRRRVVLGCVLGLVCAAAAAAAGWFLTPPAKLTARTLMMVPVEKRFLLNLAEQPPDLASHQRTQMAL